MPSSVVFFKASQYYIRLISSFVVVVFRCNGFLEIQFILHTVPPTAVCSPVVGSSCRVYGNHHTLLTRGKSMGSLVHLTVSPLAHPWTATNLLPLRLLVDISSDGVVHYEDHLDFSLCVDICSMCHCSYLFYGICFGISWIFQPLAILNVAVNTMHRLFVCIGFISVV